MQSFMEVATGPAKMNKCFFLLKQRTACLSNSDGFSVYELGQVELQPQVIQSNTNLGAAMKGLHRYDYGL